MAPVRPVLVGSRSSPLAVAQTDEVLSLLRRRFPDREFSVVPMATLGDKNKEAPLLSMEKGMFVKEIERALLDGEIDLAVHSAKDLTADLPDGLTIRAAGRRQDARDIQVNRWGLRLAELPMGARLGTSSPRRAAQIRALHPDLRVVDIRGNVGTRLEKAGRDDYDGVVLAAAGLVRLGRQAEVTEYLVPETVTPEVGQGTLAAEARSDDGDMIEMLAAIKHRPTSTALEVERSFLNALGGGCRVPVTAYARLEEGLIDVLAMAGLPDGSKVFRRRLSCDASDPRGAGEAAAEALLADGAAEIVNAA